MTVLKHIGHEIKELRISRGDTQEDAALDIEMSPSYLRRLEHGTGNPTIKTLRRIANNYQREVAIYFPKGEE